MTHPTPDPLRDALAFYADDANWRQNGPLDPNSANFTGGPARAALAAAPQPAVADREACRAKQAEPDRGFDETPYDRGYVWGYRHGLRDGKAEVAPADETMAWAVVGGDRIPNPDLIYGSEGAAKAHAGALGLVVRVAIRVVEGGDDAA